MVLEIGQIVIAVKPDYMQQLDIKIKHILFSRKFKVI